MSGLPLSNFLDVFKVPKKVSRGISKQLLNHSNYLVLFWHAKATSDTRKHDLNASGFCCDLLNFVKYVRGNPSIL